MERKPHLERCVSAHTGVSDTTVAPYEATSPSHINWHIACFTGIQDQGRELR